MKMLKWAGVGLISLSMLAMACNSNTTKKTANQNDGNAELRINASDQEALRVLSKTYTASQGIWDGFDVMEHPSIVVFRTSDKKTRAILAINFPQSPALGEVSAVDTEGAPFTAVQVTRPSADLVSAMAELRNFEFQRDIGGVSTYLIAADDDDVTMDSTKPDFGLLFVHEMFHRYQMQKFLVDQADQSLADYPFTSDNLMLAMMEERALKAAIEAESDDARLAAAKHFAAIRVERRAREARVALDDSQETYEGTARYTEHKIGGDDPTMINHEGNFASNLVTNESGIPGKVKDHFGFSRFYASGAAMVEIIRRFDVPDFYKTIETGTAVPTLLIQHVGLSEGDEAILADALKTYDPSGQLKQVAENLAEKASTETSDFDSPMPTGENGSGVESVPLTEEEIACLLREGYDVIGGPKDMRIPTNVLNKCSPV